MTLAKIVETISRDLPDAYLKESARSAVDFGSLVPTMLESEVWARLVEHFPKQANMQVFDLVMHVLREELVSEVAGSTAGAINWVKKVLAKRQAGASLSSQERANVARAVKQEYPVIRTDDEAMEVVNIAVKQMTTGKTGIADLVAKTLPKERTALLALAKKPSEIANYTREIWKSSDIDNVEPAEVRKAIVDYIISKAGIKESILRERLRMIR
jgi:predicted phage gp36 major capsid-like protein